MDQFIAMTNNSQQLYSKSVLGNIVLKLRL